ncbi:MAG: hypothetical protein ACK4MV_07905 [Beijerinckiaceae bacterium]
MIAKGEKFTEVMVTIDGSSFYDCTFERCRVVYSGLLPFTLQNPKFIDCKWEVLGPADNTLKFLGALYNAGANDLVEGTFATIRGKR